MQKLNIQSHPLKYIQIYTRLYKMDLTKQRIEILSPHYRAARDGNSSTLPASYLGENYKAPSFNVQMNNKSKD